MYLLTVECYNQVCQASLLTVNFSVRIHNNHKLYNQKDLDSEERRLFDKYLEGYFGLKIVKLTICTAYAAIELIMPSVAKLVQNETVGLLCCDSCFCCPRG